MNPELPPLDYRFSVPLDSNDTYPIFVTVPDSKAALGTGKAVKIAGTIDGFPFQATLMPSGDGQHWLPLRMAIRRQIGKNQPGDMVAIYLNQRFS